MSGTSKWANDRKVERATRVSGQRSSVKPGPNDRVFGNAHVNHIEAGFGVLAVPFLRSNCFSTSPNGEFEWVLQRSSVGVPIPMLPPAVLVLPKGQKSRTRRNTKRLRDVNGVEGAKYVGFQRQLLSGCIGRGVDDRVTGSFLDGVANGAGNNNTQSILRS